jgi:hypothetical protein
MPLSHYIKKARRLIKAYRSQSQPSLLTVLLFAMVQTWQIFAIPHTGYHRLLFFHTSTSERNYYLFI